jgi:hypothetical protein
MPRGDSLFKHIPYPHSVQTHIVVGRPKVLAYQGFSLEKRRLFVLIGFLGFCHRTERRIFVKIAIGNGFEGPKMARQVCYWNRHLFTRHNGVTNGRRLPALMIFCFNYESEVLLSETLTYQPETLLTPPTIRHRLSFLFVRHSTSIPELPMDPPLATTEEKEQCFQFANAFANSLLKGMSFLA